MPLFEFAAAYHAHASAEEAEKYRRLVEAATEAASELEADWYDVTIWDTVNKKFNDIGRRLRSAMDALKEEK
jgi:hypothetical protein